MAAHAGFRKTIPVILQHLLLAAGEPVDIGANRGDHLLDEGPFVTRPRGGVTGIGCIAGHIAVDSEVDAPAQGRSTVVILASRIAGVRTTVAFAAHPAVGGVGFKFAEPPVVVDPRHQLAAAQ